MRFRLSGKGWLVFSALHCVGVGWVQEELGRMFGMNSDGSATVPFILAARGLDMEDNYSLLISRDLQSTCDLIVRRQSCFLWCHHPPTSLSLSGLPTQ